MPTATADQATPVAAADSLLINKDWLKPHSPCADGYRWFLDKFPQGAQFSEVYLALRADKRYDDADWLAQRAFIGLGALATTQQMVKITGADAVAIASQVQADGANPDATATTGEGANAATTGNWANAATTGYRANAATTGEGANAATTGYRANAATTGNWANAATSGAKTISAALGRNNKAKAGPDGCLVCSWWDEAADRPRVAVGYVGEAGIKADAWYEAQNGALVETTVDEA